MLKNLRVASTTDKIRIDKPCNDGFHFISQCEKQGLKVKGCLFQKEGDDTDIHDAVLAQQCLYIMVSLDNHCFRQF